MRKKLLISIRTALFTAFIFVATVMLRIPAPPQGYLHPGDAMILLASWILAPGNAFFAAGIGSVLADLFSGYSVYAPGSFFIKGLCALTSSLLFSVIRSRIRKNEKHRISRPLLCLCAVFGEAVMVAGYFIYTYFLTRSVPVSLTGAAENLLQALFGIVVSVLLYPVLPRAFFNDSGRAD